MGLGLMGVAYYIAKKRNYPASPRSELPSIWPSFRNAAIALLMPVIILGDMEFSPRLKLVWLQLLTPP